MTKKHKLISVLIMICLLIGLASAADDIATDGDAKPVQPPEWQTWDRETNYPDEDGILRFWMADLTGEKASLEISYTFDDGKEKIEGAKVAVTRFATLTVKDGDAKYEIIPELKEKYPEISFAEMTYDELDAFSKELAALKLPADKEVVTDKDGKALFTDLEYGLYLVCEVGKSGTAEKFFFFKPFIINVPFPIVEAGKYKGEWKYAVASEPKTEIKGEKPTPTPYTPHARTGDDSEAFKYANAGIIGVMLLIAFIVIANLIYNKKKKKA